MKNSMFRKKEIQMKRADKSKGGLYGLASVLILGVIFLGCSNPLNEKPASLVSPPGIPPSGGDGESMGYVQVNLSRDVSARTILPSGEGLYYTLTYSDGGTTGTVTLGSVSGGGKTVSLPTGEWDLTVYGYRNPVDAGGPAPIVEGGATDVDISTGGTTPVDIDLEAHQTGNGTLRYSVAYPNNPQVSSIRLKLENMVDHSIKTITLSSASGTGTITGQIPLPSGFYQLGFYLYNGGIAVPGDLVHVYDDLETPAGFTVSATDFSPPPGNHTALGEKITEAVAERDGVKISVAGDGSDVLSTDSWITTAGMTALNDAITAAEAAFAEYGAGRNFGIITGLISAIDTALDAIENSGSYDPATDSDLGLFIGANPTAESGAGKTLASTLDWLKTNSSNNTTYTVMIGADEDLPPWTLGGTSAGTTTAFNSKNNITLNIEGKGIERVIRLNSSGSLFTVNSGVKLVLADNITLRGRADNNAALVRVYAADGEFTMQGNTKITGNTSNSSNNGGGVRVSDGTFNMEGTASVSGNISTGNNSSGGVYVTSSGTFNMAGTALVSGNTASSTSTSGGGVFVLGTFNMADNASVSGNTSTIGGVYVPGGTFTMNGGVVSENTASGTGAIAGGVYVSSGGTFTMNDGEVSGNTSSSFGGGVFVGGTFTMSGEARVNVNNPVYLANSLFITIGGSLTGTEPVALVQVQSSALNPDFIGKPFIKWAEGQSGVLPVNRFTLAGGCWLADADGILHVNALDLEGPGIPAGAYLSQGNVHCYRFTPELDAQYTVTHTRPANSGIYTAAAWEDTGVSLMTNSSSGGATTSTSAAFIATRAEADIIVIVYNGTGNYTVQYNKE
jgi:hypothetical protein